MKITYCPVDFTRVYSDTVPACLTYEYHILHLTCIFIKTLNRKILYKSKISNVNIMSYNV